jgi:hypothetical protein
VQLSSEAVCPDTREHRVLLTAGDWSVLQFTVSVLAWSWVEACSSRTASQGMRARYEPSGLTLGRPLGISFAQVVAALSN